MTLARMRAGGGWKEPGTMGRPLEIGGMYRPPNSAGKTTRPAPMGVGAPPFQKLASFDWPPPPSPAGTRRPSGAGPGDTAFRSAASGLGATTAADAGVEERAKSWASNRPTEVRNRAELWSVRADIEQEKLRNVAPFPFFGRSMRFQDEYSALQITDDGRFSYSSVTIEGSEDPAAEEEDCVQKRRVVTYEGILVSPTPEEHFGLPEDPFTEALKGQPDDEVATIEAKALARHEMEDVGGKTKLSSVEKGNFRFTITVSPYFQPSAATVQPMVRPRSPPRPQPRKKQLPYVGTGVPKRESQMVRGGSPGKAGDIRRLTQERRRAPKLKFSKSAAQLPAAVASLFSPMAATSQNFMQEPFADENETMGDGVPASRKRLSAIASAPALPSVPGAQTQESKADPKTVAEWRDFYRQRADRMLEG